MTHRVIIALGSNVSRDYLAKCMPLLREYVDVDRQSDIITTEAIGMKSPPFANQLLRCTTDLTLDELTRLTKAKDEIPHLTSCCPGWVKYCEYFYPELMHNLSTCKSPQNMMGATIKSFYAEKKGIKPENIINVSIMPCTAKKFEVGRV